MGGLAGSTDWICFWDKFCAVLGVSQLAHFHNYAEQAARRTTSSSVQFWVVVQGH